MNYRTANAPTPEPRFTERQLLWIRTTSSVEEVDRNALGESTFRDSRPAEVLQALFWLAVPFVGLGAIALIGTRSVLGAIPLAIGGLLIACALVLLGMRRVKAPAKVPVRIVDLLPAFEERRTEDSEGYEVRILYVKPRDASRGDPYAEGLVWPSKLHALGSTLSKDEKLRIAVRGDGATAHILWAHPI